MKISNGTIIFDNETSVRIERIWSGADITIIVSQGPRGNATGITLTQAEAQKVLELLTRTVAKGDDDATRP